MYQRIERNRPRQYGYVITSKLSRDEARALVRDLEAAIANDGRIQLLLELQSSPYGDFGAFWEDLKFDVKHARDLERVAVIGDSAWERAAVKLFGALTPAQCRYFERGQTDQAWAWLDEASPVHA